MLTWNYIIVIGIYGKHNLLNFLLYTLWKYLPTREQTLTQFWNERIKHI